MYLYFIEKFGVFFHLQSLLLKFKMLTLHNVNYIMCTFDVSATFYWFDLGTERLSFNILIFRPILDAIDPYPPQLRPLCTTIHLGPPSTFSYLTGKVNHAGPCYHGTTLCPGWSIR